jgi:hypothetical protein
VLLTINKSCNNIEPRIKKGKLITNEKQHYDDANDDAKPGERWSLFCKSNVLDK